MRQRLAIWLLTKRVWGDTFIEDVIHNWAWNNAH